MKTWTKQQYAPVVLIDDEEGGGTPLSTKLGVAPDGVLALTTIKPELALGPRGAMELARLLAEGLPRLQVLALPHNALGDGAAAALIDALVQPTTLLLQVDLAGNSLQEASAAALARAMARGALPLLTKLSLKDNAVVDAGAAALAAVGHPALEWLTLSGNQIGDVGGAALAAALSSRTFPKLRRLSLDRNRLGDGAMGHLAAALDACDEPGGESALEELYVDSNPASDEATRAVARRLGLDEESTPAVRTPRACEKVSVALYQSGCVCM